MFVEVKKIKNKNTVSVYDLNLRESISVKIIDIIGAINNIRNSFGVKINFSVKTLKNSYIEVVEVKGVPIQFILELTNYFNNVRCKLSDCLYDNEYYNFTMLTLERFMTIY